jgi:hypothetical protein
MTETFDHDRRQFTQREVGLEGGCSNGGVVNSGR